MSGQEYIALQVPASLYESAVQWLAQQMTGPPQVDTRTPSGRVRAAGMPVVPWTATELSKLKHELEDRPAVKALVDLLIERNGHQTPIGEYSEITGFTSRQVAAALAGFTQLVARDFGRKNWPFKVEFPDSNGGRAVYSMRPELLELWSRA
jgi:hypothetical protein